MTGAADSGSDRGPVAETYRRRTDVVADDRGDGQPVVFAHGTLMDRTMFRPQLDALGGEFRAVAYDLRARTDRWQGPYDLGDLVEDCRHLLDALGLDTTVLAGMSMGGFMGLRFALRYPERLDGLVLVDSMAAAHTDAEREQYGAMIDRVRGADRPPADLAETTSHLLFGETTHAERPDLVSAWTSRWRSYPGDAVYHEVASWLDRPDVTDRLDGIDLPVLVVHGEEDAAIEISRAEPMVERLPDARMVRVPGAGHSSNLERPEPVNDALREFLREVA